MNKITLNELFTKISNVFKNDIYIIKNIYIIGGLESEEKNETSLLLQLSPEGIEVVKNTFSEIDYVYISNIKEAKKDLDKYVDLNVLESNVDYCEKYLNKILSIVNKITNWDNFEFTDNEIGTIFEDKMSVEIFKDNSLIPSLNIGKNILPMVTPKTLDKLYYGILLPENNNDEVVKLIMSLDVDYFQLYNLVLYIQL